MTRGKLSVFYGPMGAGKTEALLKVKQQLGNIVLVFIPKMDWRSNGGLRSHNGNMAEAGVKVLDLSEFGDLRPFLSKKTQAVILDEINFLPDTVVQAVQALLVKGIDVYAAGLLLDSDLQDFGPTRTLAKLAEHSEALTARCDHKGCTQPGVFNYAKKLKAGQVAVGAFDLYGVACERHYLPLRRRYYHQAFPLPVDWQQRWQSC